MSLKKLVAAFVVVLSMFVAAPKSASAATIAFNVCEGQGNAPLCGHLFMQTTLNAGKIDVLVYGDPGYGIFGEVNNGGNKGAFGLNVNGTGVVFSNISPGFAYKGDTNGQLNGYSNFEFLFDGPKHGDDASLPFSFTVARSGGFSNDTDLFELNDEGYWAAAHLRVPGGPLTGFVASDTEPCEAVECDFSQHNTPVPEPATMLLLGTGLLVAVRARRKRTS